MYLLGAAFFFCVVTIYGVLFMVGLIAVSSESFHDRKKNLYLRTWRPYIGNGRQQR